MYQRWVTVLFAFAVAAAPAAAKPAHKRALIDLFGPALPAKLHACTTCHLPDRPGAAEGDKPHNPFGARLAALKKAGAHADITDRLLLIAEEDSDGDGVANVLELLSGHNPGDAGDKPTPAEVEAARRAWADFRAKQAAIYAWRPFAPVVRPIVPAAAPGWGRNAVDAFLAAEHARHGLSPRPEAPRHVLLRRIYLDLTGLPPTREELRAFLADASPDAYEKVVDKLLASPRYGERWGRHWMDVWRYSDWGGYGAEVRDSQKHIWHWRDWIVESLNADKGYDRMVQEMLAADELAPDDASALRATGFLVRNWYMFNRNVWLDRAVEHTGKAFLGVTLNCARCHDHFFDPIGHKEYYAFRAVFEPHLVRTDRVPGVANVDADGIPRVYDGKPAEPTYLFVRGDEKEPDKSAALPPDVPSLLGGRYTVQLVSLPLTAIAPDKRPFVVAETVAASAQAVALAQAAALQARYRAIPAAAKGGLAATWHVSELSDLANAEFEAARARHAALRAVLAAEKIEDVGGTTATGWAMAATAAASAQRELALREGRHKLLATRVAAQSAKDKSDAGKKLAEAKDALAKAEAALKPPPTTAYTKRTLATYPAASTGRRLALARWITDRQNPLAARVAVNHLWLRHFGRALVPTEFDFGKNGRLPSHPALLDWLAAEFMERGWSMKHLHRLLVTSAAYRMDSAGSPSNAARDPDNRWLWRMNPRRLEAEAVRDGVLYVAGQLDLTQGGPDLDHNLGLSVKRRSLYFRHAPEKQMEFLALFDAANVTECYRRSESVVPQQALALANSALVLAQSRLLARDLSATEKMPEAFVYAAFEQVLSRAPTAAERAECVRFLTEQIVLLADPKKLTAFAAGPPSQVPPSPDPAQRAREGLIHVLLNHSDFVTVR